jgi:5-phospho-D-xylono-1,4-lactonase
VIACTGFHRQRYYPDGHWLWQAASARAARYFLSELNSGLEETLSLPQAARAGFIKIACEALLADTPQAALEGAAAAAVESGAALQVHTEQGQSAEAILETLLDFGLSASQIVLCHMDKRPDIGLHRALAQAGVLLEYDTFYRPKYAPQLRLWPLIEQMAAEGYTSALALATDMAETSLWRSLGGGPGLDGFLTLIQPALVAMGLSPMAIAAMLGGNIASRLAWRRD